MSTAGRLRDSWRVQEVNVNYFLRREAVSRSPYRVHCVNTAPVGGAGLADRKTTGFAEFTGKKQQIPLGALSVPGG
jgi:hypothetical protein